MKFLRRNLAMCAAILGCQNWRYDNWQRPRILFNTLQGTRQMPTTINYLVGYLIRAEVEKPCFRLSLSLIISYRLKMEAIQRWFCSISFIAKFCVSLWNDFPRIILWSNFGLFPYPLLSIHHRKRSEFLISKFGRKYWACLFQLHPPSFFRNWLLTNANILDITHFSMPPYQSSGVLMLSTHTNGNVEGCFIQIQLADWLSCGQTTDLSHWADLLISAF